MNESTKAPKKPYTFVIDFETANPSPASACSVGFVILEGTKIIHEESQLIRPPTSIFTFTAIHSLRWNDVRSAPTFEEIYEDRLSPWVKKSGMMVAHNVSFDDRVLRSSGAHYGIKVPRVKTECTVRIARYKLGIKPANLAHVCQVLGIPLKHHDALSDARASARIYLHHLESYSSVTNTSDSG